MNDLLDEPDDEYGEDTVVERPEPTGVERVDAVLDAVAASTSEPLVDQVRVFDQAHAELRRALDDPGAA